MLRKTSKGEVKTLRIVLSRGKKRRGGQQDVGRNILLKMACIEEYRSKQAQGLQEVIRTRVNKQEIAESIKNSVETTERDKRRKSNEGCQERRSAKTEGRKAKAEQDRKKGGESLRYDTWRGRSNWMLSPGNPDEKKGSREQRRRELLMLWEAPPMVPPKGIL